VRKSAPEPSGHSPPRVPPSAFSLQNDLILVAAKLKEPGDVALIVVDPASITDLTKCTRATSTPAASSRGRIVSSIPLHLWPNRELRQRLDPKELAAGDPHHDSTLTKSEYLAVVEKQFRAADPDNDATLDAKELRSPAGRVVIRLTM
jgi:hypothetical protein